MPCVKHREVADKSPVRPISDSTIRLAATSQPRLGLVRGTAGAARADRSSLLNVLKRERSIWWGSEVGSGCDLIG